jgi:deoxyribonucleoside regulator
MATLGTTGGAEANLLGDEQFLRRVAYLYHEDGHSQETIAEMMACSRQTVSKALQKAKDKGIVRTSIVPDLREGYLRKLSRDARRSLSLDDVVLVAGRNFEGLGPDEALDEVVEEIGQAAAEYLDQMLTDTDVLAVSGGRTFMRKVVGHMNPSRMLPGLQVVSMIGFVEARTSFGDANLVAYDLAQAYGAVHAWYCIPAIMPHTPHVSPEAIRGLNANLSITREAMELSESANIYMFGLWTPHTNDEVVMRGIVTREHIQAIESYHPVVDINHWVFDADGRCINELLDPPPYHLTGFEIPRLKDRIRDGAQVILVAGGGPSYVPAIRAVLKAGLANILVTDHITAYQLLGPDQS